MDNDNSKKIANDPDIEKIFDNVRNNLHNNGNVGFTPLQKIDLYKEGLQEKSQHAQIESVEILRQIERNTNYLKDIVKLIHENNNNQEELIKQILDIARSMNSKEAKNKYKKAIRNISNIAETGANIVSLTNFATTVYQLVLKLF